MAVNVIRSPLTTGNPLAAIKMPPSTFFFFFTIVNRQLSPFRCLPSMFHHPTPPPCSPEKSLPLPLTAKSLCPLPPNHRPSLFQHSTITTGPPSLPSFPHHQPSSPAQAIAAALPHSGHVSHDHPPPEHLSTCSRPCPLLFGSLTPSLVIIVCPCTVACRHSPPLDAHHRLWEKWSTNRRSPNLGFDRIPSELCLPAKEGHRRSPHQATHQMAQIALHET